MGSEAGHADVATASAMTNEHGDWTAAHEKELGFAREKKRLRKCEAYEEGLLLPSEVDRKVEEEGEAHLKRRMARYKALLPT